MLLRACKPQDCIYIYIVSCIMPMSIYRCPVTQVICNVGILHTPGIRWLVYIEQFTPRHGCNIKFSPHVIDYICTYYCSPRSLWKQPISCSLPFKLYMSIQVHQITITLHIHCACMHTFSCKLRTYFSVLIYIYYFCFTLRGKMRVISLSGGIAFMDQCRYTQRIWSPPLDSTR